MLQGKYDEAEPLYRESLAIDKKIYGDEHPDVATDLNNLAGLLKAQVSESSVFVFPLPNAVWSADLCFCMLQGKYDEAEPLYRESLAIDKKIYGDEHPDVATDLNNLASLLESQVSIKIIQI